MYTVKMRSKLSLCYYTDLKEIYDFNTKKKKKIGKKRCSKNVVESDNRRQFF